MSLIPFENMRKKIAAQIEQKRGELHALEAKLELLNELEKESESQKQPTLFRVEDEGEGSYRKMGLTDAAYDAVQKLFSERNAPQGRTSIGAFMTENGFKASGPNFLTSLDQTLRRLAASGRIETELSGSSRVYKPSLL